APHAPLSAQNGNAQCCLYQGKELPNGEPFEDPAGPCRTCLCWEGSVTCSPRACPPAECPFPAPGPCCKACEGEGLVRGGGAGAGAVGRFPRCFLLPSSTAGCEYLSEHYLDGQEFPDPQEPCGLCSCLGGFVTCAKRPCFQAGCSHPARLPGQCCPACHGEALQLHGTPPTAAAPRPTPRHPKGGAERRKRGCPPAFGGGRQATERGGVPCGRAGAGGGGAVSLTAVPAARAGCTHEGRERADGSGWLSSAPCVACACLDGVATCARIACVSACADPVDVPGECCPLCPGAVLQLENPRRACAAHAPQPRRGGGQARFSGHRPAGRVGVEPLASHGAHGPRVGLSGAHVACAHRSGPRAQGGLSGA
uniref:Kielin cysteine rich BMP regulator n=1 Tax=Varanus komodoensis TaxID=61221 RepID=A0A8D2LW02_VARKO